MQSQSQSHASAPALKHTAKTMQPMQSNTSPWIDVFTGDQTPVTPMPEQPQQTTNTDFRSAQAAQATAQERPALSETEVAPTHDALSAIY